MTYVMSDIHGEYTKYAKMLKKIKFSESDELYILGDIVDPAKKQSVKILQDMRTRPNVHPIWGENDITAFDIISKTYPSISPENADFEFIKQISRWTTMLRGVDNIPQEEIVELLKYIKSFKLFVTLTVDGQDFVLVHGSIPLEKVKDRTLRSHAHEMVTSSPDYSRHYFDDAFLVTGHTPTFNIGEEWRGKIYRANGHIAIDCGAGCSTGMPLGCIRLEDFSEFYVD